jgi:putative serine protease PepD
MQPRMFLSALLGALVVAVPFGVAAAGGAFDGEDAVPADGAATSQGSSSSSSAGGTARNLTDVSSLYERVRDGVVYVQVRSEQPSLLGGGGGSGSGFVLDGEGHIVTNQHVVEDSDSVRVRIGEGRELVPARVLGTDPSSDLAVLKVDPSAVDGGVKPIELGNSKDVKVGQPTVAIGSPFGLAGSLTTGVVSALDRPITAPNNFTIDGAVQTDAAINPGNSGGPLLDAQGRVIGVNAQIATSSRSNSGVGFAIPVDTVRQVVPVLKRGGTVRRPYLGVSTSDTTTGKGARVAQTVPSGPSADAGIRTGDTIVEVDGDEIAQSADVAGAIADRKPGDKVTVKVERGGDEREVEVTLGTRPREGS